MTRFHILTIPGAILQGRTFKFNIDGSSLMCKKNNNGPIAIAIVILSNLNQNITLSHIYVYKDNCCQ